jgi:nitric oxide reductase large subunit
MTLESTRRNPSISKAWIQAVALVVLFGFLVLGLLTGRTPPSRQSSARSVSPAGQVLFTWADVTEGQQVFLRTGLMEYGSIFRHGAYLGPDFTARTSTWPAKARVRVDEKYSREEQPLSAFPLRRVFQEALQLCQRP